MKHFDRATKIVATIGPASRNPDTLGRMIDAGLNVVRMNFSHGDPEDHRQTVQLVRELAARKGVAIGILQDLQGPKIRVGRFAQGAVTLESGQPFTITMDDVYCRDDASPCDDRLPIGEPSSGDAPLARPDGQHFSDEALPTVADALLDRVAAAR